MATTSIALLPPVELGLGDACGSTVCLGVGPTSLVPSGIPKDSPREYDKGLLGCMNVAVPASHRIERVA